MIYATTGGRYTDHYIRELSINALYEILPMEAPLLQKLLMPISQLKLAGCE